MLHSPETQQRIERVARELQLPLGFLTDDGAPLTAPVELVRNTIPRHGTGILGGQSGAGKTFVGVHLMVCAAAAIPFMGRAIREPVGGVYLAAEGGGTIGHRFRAARNHAGFKQLLPIAYTAKVGDLLDRKQLKKTIEDLKQCDRWFRPHFDVPHGLTIIDTATVAFGMSDENNNSEIARICRILAELHQMTGPFTAVVHHMGKNENAGLRGGSAWRGNTDSVLLCLADRNPLTGECKNHRTIVEKHRHGPEGSIGAFEMPLVQLGMDGYGEPYFTRVVQFTGAAKAQQPKETQAQRKFREAFDECLHDHARSHRPFKSSDVSSPNVVAVPVAAVKREFARRYVQGEDEPNERRDAARIAARQSK